MTGPRSTFVADADIHALVDGRLESERRADTLRRLAGSPAARAKVEDWQGQNDLLRSAFAGIEREPLPALLDLRAKSRLQCVPANDAPLLEMTADPEAAPSRWRRAFAGLAATILLSAGLGASWLLLQSDVEEPVATASLRGSADSTLADLSTDALGRQTIDAPAGVETLPTTEIPDLRAVGYGFAGAEPADDPASILFRYQNGAEKLVVSVTRATPQAAVPAAPQRVGNAYVWHKRDKAFAVAGTAQPAKLRAIAVSLQDDGKI